MDMIESRLARREHEERVRSLIPVQGYDGHLKDDRLLSVEPIRGGVVDATPERREEAATQPGLLSVVSSLWNSLNSWLKTYQTSANEVQLKDHLNRNTSV